MKIKHLLIVCLLLAIITVGAVSASENITSDDLAVEEATEEPIEVAGNSLCQAAEQEEILADEAHDYSDEFINIDFHKEAVTDHPESAFTVMDIYFNDTYNIPDAYANSRLVFYMNGAQKYEIEIRDGMDSHEMVNNYDLDIEDYGYYSITVNRVSQAGEYNLYTGKLHVSPVYVQVSNAFGRNNIAYGEPLGFYIGLPNGATGNVTVTLNGRTYNAYCRDGEAEVVASSDGLGLGVHTALVTFAGDANYPADSRLVEFCIEPKVSYPGAVRMFGSGFMSLGEDEYIEVSGPAGASGIVNLTLNYYGYEVYDSINLTVSNGHASYSLSGLPLGYYSFTIEGMMDNVRFSLNNGFEVIENLGGYRTIVSGEITEGGYASVFIDVPPTASVVLSVDGIPAKIYMMRGPIEDMIAGLSVGTHKIKLMIQEEYNRFSKTFTVTVKSKPVPVKDVVRMTLKKVKVKRSARKLVLSATLKINGKLAKGKVIKFKFNKKTYSAKTSSKGVAKVTVKKSVLKKLKAGRKVTYTATYGKTVKKITVKVLR